MLTIKNHGALILESNFWDSEQAAAGKLYVSLNAGAFRLLLPSGIESVIADMTTAKECVVSRGPWSQAGLNDALEILFDDHTSDPFALHLSPETFDRLPAEEDAGREWVLTVWTSRRGKPRQVLSRPCFYRRVPRIPWLKPWTER